MRSVSLLVLVALEVLLAAWVRLGAGIWVGGGLAAAALVFRALTPRTVRLWAEGVSLAALWAGSLIIWVQAAASGSTADVYYSVMAGLWALAVWLAAGRAPNETWRVRWKAQVMAWLLGGSSSWLAAGYFWDNFRSFYGGLLATLACLALCRWWFRWGACGRQVLNTLILLLVGWPLADLALRPPSRIAVRPETCRLYYSYDAAKGDPDAFRAWQEYYNSQFDQLELEVFMRDPAAKHPFIPRPGASGTFVGCPISINSLGFRGPEFSAAKDGVYRIVALGESTTFGMTIRPGDTPWPEMLEKIIRERLKTRRPVQVINAGIPAYSILDNIDRLSHDLLAVRPDMIISYHGANGFYMLTKAVLPPAGPPPPVYRERPVKLAADVEYRLRMLAFRHRASRRQATAPPPAQRPLDTAYAAAYRQLIAIAGQHGIRLALANFSMAVNQDSDLRVMDFYGGGGTRSAFASIAANNIHSLLVRQLAAAHPEVCFIDTHPHLDGQHEKFMDVIHLTNEGRRQLAENIFQGIRQTLEHDLARP